MNKKTSTDMNNLIRDCFQKISLGKSFDRVSSAPSGMGGVGTARMIHGWVSKIHDDPNDSEYEDYAGTIDVTEFIDESVSATPFTYKGVMLSGKKNASGGFLIIPYMHSDITIIVDAGTKNAYVVDFSHADFIQVDSHTSTKIGVTETEDLDIEDNDSPDYDELEKTGNETSTEYTASQIVTVIKDKDGKMYQKETTSVGYKEKIGDNVFIETSEDEIKQNVGNTSIIIKDGKVMLGGEKYEPAVKGLALTQLLKNILTSISQIMTPTLMGTMPIINTQDFISLIGQVDSVLSDTVFLK